MPRQITISTTLAGAATRELTLTYLDDPPERADAVAFFQRLQRGLTPFIKLPDVLRQMEQDEAQKYLDEHPTLQQWSELDIRVADSITDADLAGLGFLTELELVKIASNGITDDGVRHLLKLSSLTSLTLYSVNITDDCLDQLARLDSLRMLDMQMALRVSGEGFRRLVERLPALTESKPPFVPPISPVMKGSPFVPPDVEFRSIKPRTT